MTNASRSLIRPPAAGGSGTEAEAREAYWLLNGRVIRFLTGDE